MLENEALTQPEEWLKEYEEQVEELQGKLAEALQEPILAAAQNLRILHGDLLRCSPQSMILHQAQRLQGLQQNLHSGAIRSLERLTSRVHGLAGRLNALSPLAVLERGYSISFDAQGMIIKESGSVKPGEIVHTRLHRGNLTSRVESIQE